MRKGSPGEEQEREDGDNLFQCQEHQTQAHGLKERTVARAWSRNTQPYYAVQLQLLPAQAPIHIFIGRILYTFLILLYKDLHRVL